MARKKKSTKRAKPMQVVSLKAALHMVKTAERRIRARKMPRRNPEIGCGPNPLRHFPLLAGRGRPSKPRKFEITTVFQGGSVAHQTVHGTWGSITKGVNRIMAKKHKTPHGVKAVKEILVDDGK